MAKKSLIACAYENGALVWSAEGFDPLTLVIADLADGIRERALIHGLAQKGSDAAAMPKSELTGNPKKDAKLKMDAIAVVLERLRNGDWSKRSGDGSGPVAGLILLAFTEYAQSMATERGKKVPTDAECKAVYDAKTKSEKFAMRNIPEVAAIMERIKSERGADKSASVDTDALLGELGI